MEASTEGHGGVVLLDVLADVQVWDHSPTVADLDGFAAQVEAADHFS